MAGYRLRHDWRAVAKKSVPVSAPVPVSHLPHVDKGGNNALHPGIGGHEGGGGAEHPLGALLRRRCGAGDGGDDHLRKLLRLLPGGGGGGIEWGTGQM